MRVVALVSGGKDSCYNMMQCQAEGHEIIALANLHPKDKGKENDFFFNWIFFLRLVFVNAVCKKLTPSTKKRSRVY